MKYFLVVFVFSLVLPPLAYFYYPWQTGARGPDREMLALAGRMAARHGLDPHLFRAVIDAESAWKIDAVSSKGAVGLGQLMPQTAKELGVDPYNPRQNLEGSARYLARQLRQFGSVELALCAYHAGPAKVRELGRCPRFPDTHRYVRRVLGAWQERRA